MAAKTTTKKKTAAAKKTTVKKSAKKPTAKSKTSAKVSPKKVSPKGTAKNKKAVTKKVTGTTSSKTKVTAKSISAKTPVNGKSTNGKPAKTYLTEKDLKFFKELIMEQKNEILENARRLRESLIDNAGDYVGDNSTFSMHMAEQGTDEMEREKAYMFIQRDEKHLLYLEKALERIAAKTYGLCVSCGKHISKARLEAVPITSHCINCKQNLSH